MSDLNTKLSTLLKYTDQGYKIFPVWWIADGKCACGNDSCPKNNWGKHPLHKAVKHGHKDASADEDVIRQWHEEYPHANWGMPMQENNLIAVDMDPRNGGDVTLETLESIHGPIESAWSQTTGGGGRHFVYRLDDQHRVFPASAGAGVDLKHPGYILIEPARTADGYYWVDGGPLDEDQPSPLPAWLLALSIQYTKPAHDPIPMGPAIGFDWMGDVGKQELWSALQAIDNTEREAWVNVGMALHYTDPRDTGDGFSLWEQWSNLEPGNCKYNAKDQAYIWRSFSRSKQSSLTLDSIYYWAHQAGWKSQVDDSIAECLERLTASIINGPDVATIGESAGEFKTPCPVPMIDEVTAWFTAQAGHGYRNASLIGALSLCSAATNRRYVATDGTPAHLYIGLAAQTINEVRYVVNGVEKIMNDAGLRRIVRTSRFGGIGALYKTLLKSPACLYLTAEWENLLRFSKRQPSGAVDAVLSQLSDLHSRTFLHIDSAEEYSLQKLSADEQPVVRHPSLTMLALLSHDAIDMLSKTSEISRGSSELMLFAKCEAEDFFELANDPDQQPTPQWLITHVRKLRGLPDLEETELDTELVRIFADNCSQLNPTPIPVSIEGNYAEFDSALSALTGSRHLRPILQGAKVNMRRLCVGLAAWNNPEHPVITSSIKSWCGGFVLHHVRQYLESIDVLMNEGEIDTGQRIVSALLDAGHEGLVAKALRQRVRKFGRLSADERAKLIDKLIDDGEIVSGDPNGQRRGMRYLHPKFVVVAPNSDDLGAKGATGGQGSGPQPNPATTRDTAKGGQGANKFRPL